MINVLKINCGLLASSLKGIILPSTDGAVVPSAFVIRVVSVVCSFKESVVLFSLSKLELVVCRDVLDSEETVVSLCNGSLCTVEA